MTKESPTAWQKLVASLKKYLWELEPVFTAGTAQATVALVVALCHPAAWVTGVIEAAFAIVAALYAMVKVEPKRPALFTGLVTAIGTLLVALGIPHVNSGLISAINGVLAIVLASLLREKVSPVHGQTLRQGLSQLRHPGGARSQAAPAAGADMTRFATDATAAADALAQVAADAKAMGAAQVPSPRPGDGQVQDPPPRPGDEQAQDVTQTPP